MRQPNSAGSEKLNPSVKVIPVMGSRLKVLLTVVLGLFALLTVDSVYLVSFTVIEWLTGQIYQDYFYQIIFLFHLVVGLLIILPVLLFGVMHMRRAWPRPNRRAVRAGLALFITASILLLSGVVLTRFEFFEINDPYLRNIAYWVHVLSPLLVAWLFVLHRLAGTRIRWRIGTRWVGFAGTVAVVLVGVHWLQAQHSDPADSQTAAERFSPSLARTASGNYLAAESLMMSDYCEQCHQKITEGWAHSVHRFSSFNNPAYRFSVHELRQVSLEREGSVEASRFCAGCHDPVPFFSGAFDDPRLEDQDSPLTSAGITCTACHAITQLNSPRGNADYTIDEPVHYPFAVSENPALRWINRQLIKAKPAFHKKTFMQDFHRTAEFCATCHKVHLPAEVNNYKWLRGQNHYDAYLLSGVSGHGISSFYYPPKAVHKCASCHMPLQVSEDFAAHYFDNSGQRKVHDHMFAAANTAIPQMLKLSNEGNEAREQFLSGALRVDIFGIKQEGKIDGPLIAPIRPEVPALQPGGRYLLETVIRTLKLGHLFTQGTADSNEVWLDVTVTSGDRVIGRSGGMADDGEVDPWSHFVNAYVLDRNGNRIDRRNGQDIFVALYNHQIPPGAADVVHYVLEVPEDVRAPISVEVKLKYRKFDTTYMRYIEGDAFVTNDLPITILAVDRVTFPIAGQEGDKLQAKSSIESWQRWNDYGIGLLRKGRRGSAKGELRQAEQAFREVERIGRADGPLNLARVYLKEGRLTDAATALRRAANRSAPPWSVTWFTGLVNKQNGFLDEAIENFKAVAETRFQEARQREFDFSKDYRVLNELGQTLFERAKQERGNARRLQRETLLREAEDWFKKTLALEPENVTAHYNLALIYARLAERELASVHRQLHMKYKPDDNAREHAVAVHRLKNPAANHAAEAVVIYDLQRVGAYGLEMRLVKNRFFSPYTAVTSP